MTEMSNAKRFVFGCLGAAVLVAGNFLGSGPDLAFDASLIFYLGFLLRVLILIIFGGVATVFFYSNVTDVRVLFHVGMSVPAIMLALVPTPRISTETMRGPTAFVASAFAQESSKPRERPEKAAPKTKEDAQKVQDSEFIRGLTGAPRTVGGEQESRFKMIFLSLLGLTVFSALANLFLAVTQSTSKRVDGAIEGFSTTWKLGFGAIVGLIGGKAL